jgi:peroxiredoxin
MVILEVIVSGVCLTSVGLVRAVYQLLLQNGKPQPRLERLEKRLYTQGVLSEGAEPVSTGFPLGSVLHDFELPALSGGTRTLSFWRGRRLLLVFFNPSCTFCWEMLPDLALVPSREDANPFIVIVSNGDEAQSRELFAADNIVHPVLLQNDSVLYTGGAALLGEARGNGNRTLLPQTAMANRGSSRSVADSRILRDGLKAGAKAPDFRLDLAGGGEITLHSYLSCGVLLVFSDPNCGPRNSLLRRLQNLEPSLNIKIILVSRGTWALSTQGGPGPRKWTKTIGMLRISCRR